MFRVGAEPQFEFEHGMGGKFHDDFPEQLFPNIMTCPYKPDKILR
jgi:hypothetical protein